MDTLLNGSPYPCRGADGEELHVIHGHTICTEGLVGHAFEEFHGCRHPRYRVPQKEIDIAKSFLALCRRVNRLSRYDCPVSGDLKHHIELWPDFPISEESPNRYLSRGAVIIAALEMGIKIAPLVDGGSSAIIGVNIRDVKELTSKEVWSWS